LDQGFPNAFDGTSLVDADFDGDGRPDLCHRDGKNRVAIRPFRSRKEGYSNRAEVHLPTKTKGYYRLKARDLNGDGIGDVLVLPHWDQSMVVFLSRDAKP
jgi:hypothetical protein